MLQQRSKTPSQTYFKHTVYGLRFLLKTEGLPYDFLQLPAIAKSTKLPVVLSKNEVWRMLHAATLLKHKLLLALVYGCGLRCAEVRSLQLQHISYERNSLHVVQSKGNKDRLLPLSAHLIRILQKYIAAVHPQQYLFEAATAAQEQGQAAHYSQRGVQWVVTQAAKKAGIAKQVSTHTLRHSYACHLLEDGMNIVTLQQLLGHQNIETTLEYLHLCQLDDRKMFSPLDTLFATCSRSTK